MIITEIREEFDGQALDQLVELMMRLYGINLLEACDLLEKTVEDCQLTIGAFDQGKIIGVVFGKKINETDWLVSPLFVLKGQISTERVGQRLLRFIENEINYHEGRNIHLLLEPTLFFDSIGCKCFSQKAEKIVKFSKSFYFRCSYCRTCSISPLTEVLLKKVM